MIVTLNILNNILTLAMNLIKAVSFCYRTYSGCLFLPHAKLPSCRRDNGKNDQKVLSIKIVLCMQLSVATCMVLVASAVLLKYGHAIYGSFVLLFLERLLKLEYPALLLESIECSDSALIMI